MQQECEISSPNVLMARLKELRAAGIVELETTGGYYLTTEGQLLLEALGPLAQWADRWAQNVGREDLACFGKNQR
ncbi:winged helix-turn-helix transcriptional regulator [Atopomonas sediminilitoris]|uniref:winged helix-turn-helix transcriptional regulator n=1 Tax=Atopomonas sediminilitoris TaxID=2919919 RepID=UPI001F4D6FD6|nr:winged helix-turn-helix transcriptional regulator [Atopomonas sediminilitoris]MCJ8169159.1 winged helix-turn-helix transcriptional regulator [Atopomonas sediminilitoris]